MCGERYGYIFNQERYTPNKYLNAYSNQMLKGKLICNFISVFNSRLVAERVLVLSIIHAHL